MLQKNVLSNEFRLPSLQGTTNRQSRLPLDLVKHICTFHNPHKTNYERVIRELILKNLNTRQLLLVKMTRTSRYAPYFLVEGGEEFKSVWLAGLGQHYDGSWTTLKLSEAEFMELFDVKVCYNFWKDTIGHFRDIEELWEIFDYQYQRYLFYSHAKMWNIDIENEEDEREPAEQEEETGGGNRIN